MPWDRDDIKISKPDMYTKLLVLDGRQDEEDLDERIKPWGGNGLMLYPFRILSDRAHP